MSLYVELLRHISLIIRKPYVAVDMVLLRKDGSFVLVKRAFEPYKGRWALPGGLAEYGKPLEESAVREAKEETGLDVEVVRVLDVLSNPGRDPRGHVVSVCFLTREKGGELKAGSDALEARAFREVPSNLAFDHEGLLRKIIKDIVT
ncbi:MAG: NUDIX hydrolase [Candidatus Hydrothermarchaeota archaeon]|nr:NUDIX hydrolase [Candidatus Hydrothermarchaeota archaeon]